MEQKNNEEKPTTRMQKYFQKQLDCEMDNAMQMCNDYIGYRLIHENQRVIKEMLRCKH